MPYENYAEQVERLKRRREMARLLAERAGTRRSGQMIGDVYVAPHWGEGLTQLAEGWLAGRVQRKVGEEEQKLAANRKAEIARAMMQLDQSVPDADVGRVARQRLMAAPENELPEPVTPRSQAMRDLSLELMPQEEVGRMMLAREWGRQDEAPVKVGPGETLYDPSARKPIYTAPAKQDLPSGMRMGLAGQPEWIPGYLDGERSVRHAGASNVNVNTERSLYGTLAEQQAKQYSEIYGAARAAPETLARTGRIRELVARTPYTGALADYKLALGKGAKALGFGYGGDHLANTEGLAAEMARSTLDAIKSSGLAGSQGLTEGERKFLERAVAGQITLEPATINRLADLNERTARLTVQRWNETFQRLDPKQMQALGLSTINLPAPAQPAAPTPPARRFTTPKGAVVEILE